MTELGIAASVGKSLLDSNIALRAKQDALLQRVREQTHLLDEDFASAALSPSTSPKSAKGKERASQLPFKSLHSLHIPAAYGAHGELVEGRPPPSPRTSLGRSTLRDLMEPKGDISTLFAHRRNASNASTSSLHSVSPVTSPSQKGVNPTSLNSALHRSHGHHRRSSSSSALGYTESASGLKSMSRSSSTKSIAELHHVNAAQQRLLSEEIQRLQLSEQNAELETRLQELEYEVSRADATGRKKLRRLDKELMGLKKELESALERNKELEDRLDRREGGKNAASGRYDRIRPSHSLPEVRIRTSSANSEHFRPDCSMPTVNESCMPTDTDVDADAVGLTHLLGADFINHAATSANDTDREATFSPVAVLDVDPMAADSIVSQLLTKINELQEANLQISAHKEALNEELLAASSQFDDMRRKYEFLEERVIEAEIRNHRILELEDGDPISEDALLAIQWPEHDSLILRHVSCTFLLSRTTRL